MRKIKKLASIAVLSAMLSLSIAGAVNAQQIGDHGEFYGGIDGDWVYSSYYDASYRWYKASVTGKEYGSKMYRLGDPGFGNTAYVTRLKKRHGNKYNYDYGGGTY